MQATADVSYLLFMNFKGIKSKKAVGLLTIGLQKLTKAPTYPSLSTVLRDISG